MALIQCHECKGRISDHARTCPHCGAPVLATIERRKKAQRLGMLVNLIGAIVIGIVAWFGVHYVFNLALKSGAQFLPGLTNSVNTNR